MSLECNKKTVLRKGGYWTFYASKFALYATSAYKYFLRLFHNKIFMNLRVAAKL